MKKKSLLTIVIIAQGLFAFGQVGVGTETPKATLDVTGKPTDLTKPDGLIAPRLSGAQLADKDALYGSDQNGAIVYATSASPTAGVSGKTININETGYYFFDKTTNTWLKFRIVVGNTFVPTVVAAGEGSTDIRHNDNGGYAKWTFNTRLNDGHWVNNEYTIPKNGFYQISLSGLVWSSAGPSNSFTWMMKYGNSRFGFNYFSDDKHGGNLYKGGSVVMHFLAGEKFTLGGEPCQGCRNGGTAPYYLAKTRAFSITYLGE
ncbi:MAG: hypothetical protein ACK5MD_06085 [Flavobacteriales bacterium]